MLAENELKAKFAKSLQAPFCFWIKRLDDDNIELEKSRDTVCLSFRLFPSKTNWPDGGHGRVDSVDILILYKYTADRVFSCKNI